MVVVIHCSIRSCFVLFGNDDDGDGLEVDDEDDPIGLLGDTRWYMQVVEKGGEGGWWIVDFSS